MSVRRVLIGNIRGPEGPAGPPGPPVSADNIDEIAVAVETSLGEMPDLSLLFENKLL